MAIFRPERIVPIDAVPGAGLVSPIWDEIQAMAQEVADLPADDAREVVQPAAVTALQALSQLHRQHWLLADKVESLMKTPMAKAAIGRGQEGAAAQLPTNGWGAPQDLWAAQAGERARVLRGFQTDAANAAVAGRSGKLAKAGSECVDALLALANAIDEAVSDFESPAALQQDVTIEDLHRQAQCEQEILALADQAMPRGLVMLEQAIRHNKLDRLKNLIPSLLRAANEICVTPPAKLMAKRASHYTANLYDSPSQDAPIAAAHRVIRAIRDWRESQRPQSIAVVTSVLQRTRPIFASLAGRDAPEFMTTDQLLNRARGGDGAHVGPPWEIDTSWPLRYLPPSPVRLPGWSRIVMKTDGRIPVREPAPVPLVGAEVRGMSGGAS